MDSNYRMIESVKERILNSNKDTVTLGVYDDVSKIEYPNGREVYEEGFTDYHKP